MVTSRESTTRPPVGDDVVPLVVAVTLEPPGIRPPGLAGRIGGGSQSIGATLNLTALFRSAEGILLALLTNSSY
jgi:hypothetical protein